MFEIVVSLGELICSIGFLASSILFAFIVGILNIEALNYIFKIFPGKMFTSILIEWCKSSDNDGNDPNGGD